MAKSPKHENDYEDDVNEDTLAIKPRIQLLKEKAQKLGISYSPNIGEETLAARINDYLNGKVEKEAHDDIEEGAGLPLVKSVNELRLEAQKLIRVVVTPNDPMKTQMAGEFVWTGNSKLPTFGKYIPFSAPRGFHVPQIILDALRDRTYTAFALKKDQYGNDIPYAVQRKAYNIEILPPLTQKQIEKIADRQAAYRKWEEEDNYDEDEV